MKNQRRTNTSFELMGSSKGCGVVVKMKRLVVFKCGGNYPVPWVPLWARKALEVDTMLLVVSNMVAYKAKGFF